MRSYPRETDVAPRIFSLDSKPYGLTYGEWTAKWWRWLVSIPKKDNPAADTTGVNCAVNQAGPVWFLAGTFGGSAERTCTVPAGKAILFPIINAGCSFAENPNLKTESELRSCAKVDIDTVLSHDIRIDGMLVINVQKYRVSSPLFDMILPENNVFGIHAGHTQGVSDGYWIFLHPLHSGKHTIYFLGKQPNFEIRVVYNLMIKLHG